MKKSMGLMEDEIRRLRSRPKPQPDMGLQNTIADHLGTISGLRNELDGSLRRRDEACTFVYDSMLCLQCAIAAVCISLSSFIVSHYAGLIMAPFKC